MAAENGGLSAAEKTAPNHGNPAAKIGLQIAMGLIYVLVTIYTVITLPFYFLIQMPLLARSKAHKQRAVHETEDDPLSPWVATLEPPDHYISKCQTISELFKKTVEHNGNRPCVGYRDVIGEEEQKQPNGRVFRKLILDDYQWINYNELDRLVHATGKGLLKHGVKPRDIIMVFAETRFEWQVTAQATFKIGASIATLYPTLGDEGIIHGINETEVTHLVTTQDLLPKLAAVQDKLTKLNTIIYIEGHKKLIKHDIDESRIKLVAFSALQEDGRSEGDQNTNEIIGEPPTKDTLAILMYTSGSTGNPKGVLLTHENLVTAVNSYLSLCQDVMHDAERHTFLAYLPLAHSLELTAECFFYAAGVRVGYATPNTLMDNSSAIKRGQKGDAAALRPTIMPMVPLICDRIRKEVEMKLAKSGPFVQSLVSFALSYKKFWDQCFMKSPIVESIICSKVKSVLGGRLEYVMVGGAPLSPDTQEFIRTCLNVTVMQGYGATETTATGTIQDMYDMRVGVVGAPIDRVKMLLKDWPEGGYHITDVPNPRGEVIFGGPMIAKGYFKLEEETKKAFYNEQGIRYFMTGDIGEVLPDGSLRVIDRKKDLVKLQAGEYISLGKVESKLKACPSVENICVDGNSAHNYVIALITPNPKQIKTIADNLGKSSLDFPTLCNDPEVTAAVLDEIQSCGKASGLHKSEIPAKIKLISDEWSPSSGHLTASMKIKRKIIQDDYRAQINSLYGIH